MSEKLLKRFNYKNYHLYLQERKKSKYKIVMFLEYIPTMLYKIIEKDKQYIKKFFYESQKILDFLQTNGILHLDTHWGNYLVDDNNNLYLTDFGLVLDKNYNLDEKEKIFMKKNKLLPYYYKFESLYVQYINFMEKNNIINDITEIEAIDYKKLNRIKRCKFLLNNIDKINKIVKFPQFYVDIMKLSRNKIIKVVTLREKIKNITSKTIYL